MKFNFFEDFTMKQPLIFSLALLVLFFSSSALFAHEHEDCDHQETCVDQKLDVWCTGSVRAMLCSSCGFGSKKDNCVICGKWMGSTRIPAYLCSSCGFGSKKDNCVLCGKWIGGSGVPACICGSCGFGSKKDNCVKCGKWRGGN